VPVIMLTVRNDEDDRVRGLDLGADDYLGKPFSPRELVSRIRAVLRRTRQTEAEEGLLKIDDYLTIDMRNQEVIVGGKRVKLRPTEWKLLYHLVKNAGWVMTHDMLLAKVWGHEYQGTPEYVRLYITYLRKKIEPDPSNPRYILTEYGTGYRFVDEWAFSRCVAATRTSSTEMASMARLGQQSGRACPCSKQGLHPTRCQSTRLCGV